MGEALSTVIISDEGYPCQYTGPEFAKTSEIEEIKKIDIIFTNFFIRNSFVYKVDELEIKIYI
jgi:hypothetical protein